MLKAIGDINNFGLMKRRIYYIGFYDNSKLGDRFQNRTCSSAAVNLIDYVSSVIGKTRDVFLLSPSWTLNKWSIFRGQKIKHADWLTICFPFTVGSFFKPLSFLGKLYSHFWILYYLLFVIGRREKVVVYHSVTLAPVIIIAKLFRKFELILQVNEIYQNVENIGGINSYFEKRVFSYADSFIFSTVVLNDIVNPLRQKPFIVCGGVYRNVPTTAQKFHDGKIHLVYSGIIDKIKLGAFLSTQLAAKLNSDYIIHIVGFGLEPDINELKLLILEVNKLNLAKVLFDGVKTGDEFNNYLQRCNIGLALQAPDGLFNETSFPSKIFTYMANGLYVVSVRSASICSSPASESIYFGENNSLESIAQCIMNIPAVNKSNNVLMQLHSEFEGQLENILCKE